MVFSSSFVRVGQCTIGGCQSGVVLLTNCGNKRLRRYFYEYHLLIFSTFRAKKGRKNGKSPSPQPLTKIKIEKFEKEIEF